MRHAGREEHLFSGAQCSGVGVSDDDAQLTFHDRDPLELLRVAVRGGVVRIRSEVKIDLHYASPAYIARRGTPRTSRDLQGHDWVVLRSMRGPMRLEGPGEPIVVQPAGRIVTDDFLFVREAARAGEGIAIMDSLFAEKDILDGRLVCLLPRYRVTASGLYLVYPATRHLPRKVSAFRDLLLEVIKARTASRY